jgi:hypothetical protein
LCAAITRSNAWRRVAVDPRVDGDTGEVHLLGDEHTAGPQRRDEAVQGERGVGEPREQQTHVDEVVLVLRQVVDEHVVHADVEVRPREVAKDGRVEVGRDDGPVRADAVAQPRGMHPLPAPTSRHRDPGRTPIASRWRIDPGSSRRARAARRCRWIARALSNAYVSWAIVVVPPWPGERPTLSRPGGRRTPAVDSRTGAFAAPRMPR